MDIYGKCGDKQCGEVKNVGHEYSTAADPCFHMVNRNYRSYFASMNLFMPMNCCFDVSNLHSRKGHFNCPLLVSVCDSYEGDAI